MMDMRALKVRQEVILSGVLHGTVSRSVVTEITKGHVSIQVEARIGNRDGA
jgi:hypothetical protein